MKEIDHAGVPSAELCGTIYRGVSVVYVGRVSAVDSPLSRGFLGCAAILAAAQPLNPVIVVEISRNFKKFQEISVLQLKSDIVIEKVKCKSINEIKSCTSLYPKFQLSRSKDLLQKLKRLQQHNNDWIERLRCCQNGSAA